MTKTCAHDHQSLLCISFRISCQVMASEEEQLLVSTDVIEANVISWLKQITYVCSETRALSIGNGHAASPTLYFHPSAE